MSDAWNEEGTACSVDSNQEPLVCVVSHDFCMWCQSAVHTPWGGDAPCGSSPSQGVGGLSSFLLRLQESCVFSCGLLFTSDVILYILKVLRFAKDIFDIGPLSKIYKKTFKSQK